MKYYLKLLRTRIKAITPPFVPQLHILHKILAQAAVVYTRSSAISAARWAFRGILTFAIVVKATGTSIGLARVDVDILRRGMRHRFLILPGGTGMLLSEASSSSLFGTGNPLVSSAKLLLDTVMSIKNLLMDTVMSIRNTVLGKLVLGRHILHSHFIRLLKEDEFILEVGSKEDATEVRLRRCCDVTGERLE